MDKDKAKKIIALTGWEHKDGDFYSDGKLVLTIANDMIAFINLETHNISILKQVFDIVEGGE